MGYSCFKAYDIRGRIPDQINPELAERIGRAYVAVTGAKNVIVGYDIRLSSPEMAEALGKGLMAAGADVYDIGLCGTEQVYFATSHYKMDGGIMVTASHNPKDYNGMKLVREDSKPISNDTGLRDIHDRLDEAFEDAATPGAYHTLEAEDDYIEHLLGYVDSASLKPLAIVVNAGNGGAGRVIDQLESRLPFNFIKLQNEPDGNFPNGVPNPILPENRKVTEDAVKSNQADLGIAWDGDYDRCFFWDENGRFIEGYYIVGLLADQFLRKHGKGGAVIHDPRLVWNTQDLVEQAGGRAVESKTGHAFIKERMRAEDALYGGEMSAHHYFKDFAYCDSGMIPWLLLAERICQSGQTLSSLIDARIDAYPASGEINRTIDNPPEVIKAIEEKYSGDAESISHVDGLSVAFKDWRFNLRMSNTEPVVRLNVESRGDKALMEQKTEQLLKDMDALNA
ncbi:colanic acid biosynthesis phosphomannomutase CpsG [Marinobacter nanhaiticus D15-8W]|uniref:phosphomannomutase n=1 Tax=Marinobacter nanhaiticus D15-8W TaxID=626887 RepID=N6WUR3_9GAMM|nr:phosphomannomutase/phosphoglucomutase [Marinobacter nanhaiticus]ENO14727.2 phosphomannomutase/phosphoglucomutase [Marinobacter nanhaiticus D15-8W]BES69585.1 colanic acid biosynthesis phosphomannomutase CpsG [Marinobacter nanhaiticus D15-8W]